MAILKHIKSRNANYSNAIDYLLFQHDESTGKKIKDEMGRSLLRDEFYMDGLNCDPMSFDKECSLTNAKFHKNKKSSEIKSHHYIISYDPADAIECDLTGEKAQALSLDLAKKIFPGYQALIVTHTDGHNGSGNIHKVTYTNLLTSGRLNAYLADINRQAQERFERLIEGMKQAQGITEQLKAENALEWTGCLNNIRACAREIVEKEIIFA